MTKLSFIFPVLLALFALISHVQASIAISFSSPQDGAVVPMNSQVLVALDQVPVDYSAAVTQACPDEDSLVLSLPSPSFSANFQLPTSYTGLCTYLAEVRDQDDALVSPQPVPVTVSVKEQLEIASPITNSQLTIGAPFDVLVTTTNTADRVPITLTFSAGASSAISALTNIIQSVILDDGFFTTSTLTVTTSDSNYIAPAPITMNFKYQLSFTYSPKAIFPNIPFQVDLTTSAIPSSPAPEYINLFLFCGASEIYNWMSVPLNTFTTLSGIPVDARSNSYCIISTTPDSVYYYVAYKSIIIATPPFGSQLYPITPVQQVQFAVDIAFPPGIVIPL